MTFDQSIVLLTLLAMLWLFIWGRWRYDLVAVSGLLFLSLLQIVPATSAFYGFSHPAVITVVAVLLIGSGLHEVGFVDRLASWMSLVGKNLYAQLAALCLSVTLVSSFMNNIGALAVFMPIAIEMANRSQRPKSIYLMPIAFSSLLGGMTTLIGTPPNIIIANFRLYTHTEAFSMFDFTPVGLSLAVIGVLFIIFIGWRLLPIRQVGSELFEVEKYLTEVFLPQGSKLIGKMINEIEQLSEGQIQVVSIKREGRWQKMPSIFEELKAEDVLVVEVDSQWLQKWVKLGLVGIIGDFDFKTEDLKGEELELMEVVVMPGSQMIGRLAHQLRLRYRFGINLLAVARQHQSFRGNLKSLRFQVGDVLLLRAPSSLLADALPLLSCLPIATRTWQLEKSTQITAALATFVIALALSASGYLALHISLMLCALVYVLAGWINVKKIYEIVPWAVIVLLGAMIPVGQALEGTGAAQWIASQVVYYAQSWRPEIMLWLCLIFTMTLSDAINNAAAAILMAPIASNMASTLGLSVDPFLMSVAIGASCSFLTPIGHQCNALIMGPGGYKFGDYWRLGLPLEIIIAILAPIFILYNWPLTH